MGFKYKADGKIKWFIAGIAIDDFQRRIQGIIADEVKNETNFIKLFDKMTINEQMHHFDYIIRKLITVIIPHILTEFYVMEPISLADISLYDIVSANWVEIIADEFRDLMQYEAYNEITNRSNG